MRPSKPILFLSRSFLLFLIFGLILISPMTGSAQSYSFQVEQETVHVYWNEDGTQSLDYTFIFNNDPGGAWIEYVDVATPNANYDLESVSADVDGVPVDDISRSTYIETGPAIGLGRYSIPPGESARVHVFIGTVRNVMYPDEDDSEYVSAVFSPTWFDRSLVRGNTDLTVTFHLPPGVQPEEPRWHNSPSGFPATPDTGLDEQGRIIYTWRNPQADPAQQYLFGASFPAEYVPAESVVRPDPFAWVGELFGFIAGVLQCLPGLFILAVFLLIGYGGVVGSRQRKLQYLPPKISIEGHGIKRGLTAIEAAILMEQPVDKVLTMMLFAVIKKGAAKVISRDPLELEILEPLPENLRDYEREFLAAFKFESKAEQRRALQDTLVNFVNSISQKMKGFSRRETIAYYKDIMKRAWSEVETAETPEVKSQRFDEVMEWTMLDRNYDDRTREVFRTGPVYVPVWWGRYDPGFGRGAATAASRPSVSTTGRAGQGSPSLPHLPGSDFAASVVNGVQTFSAGVIGDVTNFTSRVTNRTNPVPVSTSSSSRGGGGGSSCACACACACAGCACACAGGGR